MSTIESPGMEPLNDTLGEGIPGPVPSEDLMVGTMEELQAAIDDGRIPMPEQDNEPPPVPVEDEWYKCRYGHLQRGAYFLINRDPTTGEIDWQSGVICARCQAQHTARKFPSRRVAPPKAQ